MHDEHNGQR